MLRVFEDLNEVSFGQGLHFSPDRHPSLQLDSKVCGLYFFEGTSTHEKNVPCVHLCFLEVVLKGGSLLWLTETVVPSNMGRRSY